MTIRIYKTSSRTNALTKTLTNEKVFNKAKLLNPEDVVNPTLSIISEDDLTGYNYAKIDEFNRAYFARVEVIRDKVYKLTLDCDVLSSRATELLNRTAVIARSETVYNRYLNDDKLTTQAYKRVKTIPFNEGFSPISQPILIATSKGA